MAETFVFRARTFAASVVRLSVTHAGLRVGIPFATYQVTGIAMALVYDEPTVMWRMHRAHVSFHAVIAPRSDGAAVIWFINDRPLGRRDFHDWGDALRWSEQLQFQNWAAGWRLSE